MQQETRRPVTPEEEREVRFWVDALLRGERPAAAAEELYRIGVRTRGAIRTRGSMQAPAAPRFPTGTDLQGILKKLKQKDARLRAAVASALAEWGGEDEALDALARLAVGKGRDIDPAVRGAAVDAIGVIGGPRAEELLTRAAEDDDPTVRSTAGRILESLKRG